MLTFLNRNNVCYTFVANKKSDVKELETNLKLSPNFKKDNHEDHSDKKKTFNRTQKLLIICGIAGISLFAVDKLLKDNVNRKVIHFKEFYLFFNLQPLDL